MTSSDDAPLVSDQSMWIFSWICFGVTCQMINLFGIVTNIINIIVFAKQGFTDSVNVSLLGLSVSDLGSLVAMVCTCVFFTPSMTQADLPFDNTAVCYLTSGVIHFAFTRVSGYITAMITIERCLCITAPLKIQSLVTTKRTTVITFCLFVVFIFSGSPVYAVNSLGLTFSVSRNRTVYGLVSTDKRRIVDAVSFSINSFLIPFVAFIIIVVCTIILSFKLQSSVKWRLNTLTNKQVDRVSDRHQKTAKLVVMVSILFIICFIPVNLIVLAFALLPSLSINGKDVNTTILISCLGYMLESINSSINKIIYYRMSTKYRETLRQICGVVIID